MAPARESPPSHENVNDRQPPRNKSLAAADLALDLELDQNPAQSSEEINRCVNVLFGGRMFYFRRRHSYGQGGSVEKEPMRERRRGIQINGEQAEGSHRRR
jgi:hypothetical protein